MLIRCGDDYNDNDDGTLVHLEINNNSRLISGY